MTGPVTEIAGGDRAGIAERRAGRRRRRSWRSRRFRRDTGRRFADFAHVAEHEDLATDGRGQHVDAGAHRIGIRVVGVVEHDGAVQARPPLQPPLDAPEGLDSPAIDGRQRNTGRERRGGAASALRGVVQARRQRGPRPAPPAW